MAPEITKLTKQFLHSPVTVEVTKASSTASTITQRLVKSGNKAWDKRAVCENLSTMKVINLKMLLFL